jgi:hypothetical protein
LTEPVGFPFEFAQARYSALARKLVFQLQRIKASGVYGDDYRHKTLWDEYCHEVQEGPYNLLDHAWDRTLTPALSAIVDAIPRYEAALLTIGSQNSTKQERKSQSSQIG